VEVDTGVVQINSLTPAEEETVGRAAQFYADFEDRVAAEADTLRRLEASLVIGDIPPLAFAAAARAGIPSVAISNFTWDWIYEGYPEFTRAAPRAIDTIRDAYSRATIALRLPMHGGFAGMRDVRDIPFVARRSTRERADTRRLLGVRDNRRLVLWSFGGFGLDVPATHAARSNRFVIMSFDANLPAGVAYPDLVAAADVVVSKPGYGIVSECIANHTPLLYTSRGRFAEYDVMVREMPAVMKCRFIPQNELLGGDWSGAIDALLAQPDPPEQPRIDGADVAADMVARMI
jgi:L-arabinokinase